MLVSRSRFMNEKGEKPQSGSVQGRDVEGRGCSSRISGVGDPAQGRTPPPNSYVLLPRILGVIISLLIKLILRLAWHSCLLFKFRKPYFIINSYFFFLRAKTSVFIN